jgi:hypothetical protein
MLLRLAYLSVTREPRWKTSGRGSATEVFRTSHLGNVSPVTEAGSTAAHRAFSFGVFTVAR